MNKNEIFDNFRATLSRLDLYDMTLQEEIRQLSKAFMVGYERAIYNGSASATIQPGETLDGILKSIKFP